ncbi:protein FAM163A-like [Halichoeres trimaculatus]|uniref:protein FAM163A-like n=1 Tax=Halichoeres trimaculatus TaxID=147232 RepID=UPI003D9FA484
MSAGTIVISGGILAGVILLCIIAVLCYCRLQYYCCKKNGSEADAGPATAATAPTPDPLSHFPCNACNLLAMDGAAITPVSLDQLDSGSHHNHCPTCSPYSVRSGLANDMRNGGERLGFHTYYENPSVSLALSVTPQGSPHLSHFSHTGMFPPPPRPYSTQV